jgi:hypothetical protein
VSTTVPASAEAVPILPGRRAADDALAGEALMLVLLVDGVGRVRELSLPYPSDTVLVPMQQHVYDASWPACCTMRLPVAVFRRTDADSWPPVYRWLETRP